MSGRKPRISPKLRIAVLSLLIFLNLAFLILNIWRIWTGAGTCMSYFSAALNLLAVVMCGIAVAVR